MTAPSIVEISFENAQQVLIEGSMQHTVVVEFYSPQIPACAQLSHIINAQFQASAGAFCYARVNMDELAALASQLGITQAPAMVILKEGRPADGFGELPSDAEVIDMLGRHLPQAQDILLAQAQQALSDEDDTAALNLANQAHQIAPERNDIKLVLIHALLNNKQAEPAETLLNSLPLEEQQADYLALRSQLELLQAAADSPEIKALEEQLASQPEDQQLRLNLAVQYSQAGRNEEALSSLYTMLQGSLECLDGQVKKHFLDMLVTLNGDAIASSYRRKYYSLLY